MATETRVEAHPGSRAGQHVLEIHGPITVASVPAFQEAVKASTGSAMIVNLADVPFIDSSAIGALVQAYASCQRSGRKLALAGLNHRVRALLKITSLDVLFATFGTVAEAEAALA